MPTWDVWVRILESDGHESDAIATYTADELPAEGEEIQLGDLTAKVLQTRDLADRGRPWIDALQVEFVERR